jgi:hypothetical protein
MALVSGGLSLSTSIALAVGNTSSWMRRSPVDAAIHDRQIAIASEIATDHTRLIGVPVLRPACKPEAAQSFY